MEKKVIVEGWEVTNITYFIPDYLPPKEIDIGQLGWWLYHRQISNIWWKKGYFMYFNSNSDLTTDHVKKTILIFTEIDNIFYTVGGYKRFIKINLEDWKTELTNEAKNSTEYIHIPVFALPNPKIDEIFNQIVK